MTSEGQDPTAVLRASLADASVLVAGGGGGIGREIARAFGTVGARVTVAGRTAASLDDTVAELAASGAQALAIPTDVTDGDAVEACVRQVRREWGRLDVLVNSSGVLLTKDALQTSPAEWDRVISTNLTGTFLLATAAARVMQEEPSGGSIINVSSNFALKGVKRHAAYTASKAGVVALGRVLATEWAPAGVRVNTLAPGFVTTGLNEHVQADQDLMRRITRGIPVGRVGRPSDVATWALLLASPLTQFVTGSTIVIDGGEAAQ